MDFGKAGNGSGRGLVDVSLVVPGCSLFRANPQQPPPDDEMPMALAHALAQWQRDDPALRVRTTLPLVKAGYTFALIVWWDRTA
jgi:hypothetical protein